jgi:trk system potassium uptake protein TrkH
VTGLVVRDTGTGFTLFGQTVIMLLIQLGGLGIMSLTAALSLLLGRGIGVRENSLLREVFQVPMLDEAGRVIRAIILVTLGCEAVGAACLYIGFSNGPPPPGPLLFTAVFHAVSAFCNAGFATYPDSMMSFADNPWVMAPLNAAHHRGRPGLRRAGADRGLVARPHVSSPRARLPPRPARPGGADGHGRAADRRLRAHRDLRVERLAGRGRAGVEAGAGILPVHHLPYGGLQQHGPDLLTQASLLVMIVLMYIGGAPGSTAGGVKVTAVAIAWANLRSITQGRSRVWIGRRELEAVHVQRALLVLSAALVAAALGTLILLLTEGRDLMVTTFEVFSALGTVGLSLGLTPFLTPAGQLVIIMLMFIGRLGPLTLASSLTGDLHEPHVRLPRGRILIG